MHDVDRIIGKLEEHKDWSKDQFKLIEKNFELLREQIKSLDRFRWKLMGGSVVAAAVTTFFFEVLRVVLEAG